MGLFDSIGSIAADVASGGLAIPFQAAQQGETDANNTNIQLSDQAANFNQQSANAAMNFSQQMSSTAYQRGTADMQAAGLNPILAAGTGGDSAPQGVSASQQAAQVDNTVTPAINATLSTAGAISTAAGIPSSIQLKSAQADQASAQAAATPDLTQSNINLNNSMAAVNNQKANEINAELPAAYQQRDFYNKNPDWFRNNQVMDIIKKGVDTGASASSILGNLMPKLNLGNIFNGSGKSISPP